MVVPSPPHHHQPSPEGIIGFSTAPSLSTGQRRNIRCHFYDIVAHFEATTSNNRPYNYSRLVRFTYEYIPSEKSRDTFLHALFQALSLAIDVKEIVEIEQLRSPFIGFADYLLDNLFLPLKASGKKTPQPSPTYHSAAQRLQGGAQDFLDRVSALRGDCLIRDRHRCVVSRKYDQVEAVNRLRKGGDDAQDDDGQLLIDDSSPFDILEVAHILPHSLTKTTAGSPLDTSKEAALSILSLFDGGIRHLIEGTDIDLPHNAITLTHSLHDFFGDFQIFFEPLSIPYTYKIDTFLPPYIFRDPAVPVTRSLYHTDHRTIDPPSPRLLAIHNAIGHILHLSAVGDYIDALLRDMEETGVQEDGSTDLGRILKLSLGGWLNGTVGA